MILIPLIWLLAFPLKSSFDTGDVIIEGAYLAFALFSLYLIHKLGSFPLLFGWFIFVYGLTFDFLDEFTKEPDLFSVYLEGFLTASGLLLIAIGFYREYSRWELLKSALQKNNQRLELANELSQQGIWEYDLDSSAFSYISSRCYDIIGCDPQQHPDYLQWRNLVHPDDVDLISSTVSALVEDRNPVDLEVRINDLNDNWKWILIRMGIDSTDLNHPRKIVGVCVDVTSRKQAEDQLKRSNELKEMFVDILRHDLLNPIGVIKAYADLLSTEKDEVLVQKYLQRIRMSTEKLLKMVTDAATLAKIESIDDVELVGVDLREIVAETIDEMHPIISEKKINITFFRKGQFPAKSSKFIKNAFENLLSNAIKYSPEGSTVKVDIEDMNTFWKISVSDKGPGVGDEYKKEIFERFKRIHRGAIKGSGLGLAIVKRIMELSGGEVGVSENPEGGSIFWLTVPKA
ncbi:sensor histidine kinase [Methanohalophilus sp.]|uniref:sensor histidine kinase n=1 Tax=Methanohalophilus sp. TaxID=1966352 RepID=UPI0026240532|nr:sensor histidine kinase [Methanohalophilus sp.]